MCMNFHHAPAPTTLFQTDMNLRREIKRDVLVYVEDHGLGEYFQNLGGCPVGPGAQRDICAWSRRHLNTGSYVGRRKFCSLLCTYIDDRY